MRLIGPTRGPGPRSKSDVDNSNYGVKEKAEMLGLLDPVVNNDYFT